MSNLIERVWNLSRGGLKREDLVTEIIGDILESTEGKIGLRSLLSSLPEFRCPETFWAETQQRKDGSRPDISLYSDNDDPSQRFAIIENKFFAKFTRRQKSEYLKLLPFGGLMIVVVPISQKEDRLKELYLSYNCSESFSPEMVRLGRFFFDGRFVWLLTWNEFLDCFNIEDKGTDYSIALRYLKGFCEVMEKQIFPSLTTEDIDDPHTSQVVCQFKWLASALAERCILDGVLKNFGKRSKQTYRNTGDPYGGELLADSLHVWIGFWPEAWASDLHSTHHPLWLWVKDIQTVNQENFLKSHGFTESPDGDNSLCAPLPLQSTDQATNVENAFAEVKKLVGLLKRSASVDFM